MGVLTINTDHTTTDTEWLFDNTNKVLQQMMNRFAETYMARSGQATTYMFDIDVEWPIGDGTDFVRLTYDYFVYDKQEKRVRDLVTLYQKVAKGYDVPVTSIKTKALVLIPA